MRHRARALLLLAVVALITPSCRDGQPRGNLRQTRDTSGQTIRDAATPVTSLDGGIRDAVSLADVARADGPPADALRARDAARVRDGASARDAATSHGDQQKPPPTLQWRQANLTWFTSYPDPGSEECIKYNGCEWAGMFAALEGKQPENWVQANNIAAVHSKDFDTYKLKTLRLKQGAKQIDVTVYDMCSDSDCDGCCTENSKGTGYLIDLESYTAERFGVSDGVVDWACLDCQ